MERYLSSMAVCALFVCLGCTGSERPADIEAMAPLPGFAEGWRSDDGTMVFDKETLFEHINGEAEIFFPFGFTEAVSITYRKQGEERTVIMADIYAMGSPDDALGLYSKFRHAEDDIPEFAVDGFSDEYQLIFCRDKYFMRITAIGKWDTSEQDLVACGKTIADRMPH